MKQPKHTITFFILSVFILLIFTRFVNLGWGLPYPMHPDERNMVNAITQLDCNTSTWKDCLDPEFYAYGQLPLYLAYFGAKAGHFFQGNMGNYVSYDEAAIALRVIAAMSAVGTAVLLYLSLALLSSFWLKKGKKIPDLDELFYKRLVALIGLLIVFVPGLIQLSHFGTTESILMLCYTAITWLSLSLFAGKIKPVRYVVYAGIITGVALASKVSALPFGAVPGLALLMTIPFKKPKTKHLTKTELKRYGLILAKYLGYGALYGTVSICLGLLLSPYNWLNYADFYSSMYYESGVGWGMYRVFYTRSFEDTAPILFHIGRIFPYVIGLPVFILFILGFILLPWRRKEYIFLRFVFLLHFLPQAFFYAKWTRFIAPVYPIMVLIASVYLIQLYYSIRARMKTVKNGFRISKGIIAGIILLSILPGLAFLSIYLKPDVRYTASEWIYTNIPENSNLLAETANVVDIPIVPPDETWEIKGYNYISFDFYNLDTDHSLPAALESSIQQADYIIVNSRRVYKNHTCLEPFSNRFKPPVSIDQMVPVPAFTPINNQLARCGKLTLTYPRLQEYYSELFNEQNGFELVAEFTSYPEISLFGVPLIEFPDENAEETWTVFDHPVIRIYKRTRS